MSSLGMELQALSAAKAIRERDKTGISYYDFK